MKNLSVKYMGIELKNPVIIGANPMTSNIDTLKKIEEAGAAAVVFRSLFEEQIQLERLQMEEDIKEYADRFAEQSSLYPEVKHAGPEEHLYNLRKAKESVGIPVIASLNAISEETWVEYAQQIEQTGVDGIELNFYSVPKDFDSSGENVENNQIEILKAVKKKVSIPVSVKLSFFYSNPLNFISKLDKKGADGFVLFNRFYQPGIDIFSQKIVSGHNLSNQAENEIPLRFAGLLYSNINAGICSNSGIHEGSDVIKMLLAGANCVQMVSTIYKNGISHISEILQDVVKWMDSKNYNSISEFNGLLSKKNIKDPFVYKRSQYVDLLINSDEIFNKHPMV
jgi:dihydroorotate dehydrogenase (fumarate)